MNNVKKYWKPCVIGVIAVFFVIYKITVLNIKWTISEEEADAWVETVLPMNATQVLEAESQTELLRLSYYMIIPLIFIFIGLIIIGKKKGWFMPSKKGFVIGAVASFLLQGLHELLHGLAFPSGSEVYIGIIKANFSGYATSASPMNYIQCIVYYLLPAFVLGFVPLLGFIFDKEKKSTMCWFCYGFAMIGLIQTAPDWFGLFPIIQQVPHNAMIQMSGWHTYWYLK
ncbi:MAG: DUF3267 domain-containing protein [Lachnospiraceae bacterium]|nr:DUF3267 domain-containing protein [Lachnospiraceae bacterium]